MKNKPVVIHQNCHSQFYRQYASGTSTLENVGQVLPDIKSSCHPRFCRPQDSGISTLFSSSPLEGEGGTQCRVRGYQRAFTLIELLVVVLIIGILAAVAVPQYQKAVDKTKLLNLLPLARAVKNEQELFYLANGRYASSWEELGTEILPFPMNTSGDFAYSPGNLRVILYGGKQYMGVGPFTPDFLWIWNYDHNGFSEAGILDCYAYNARAEKVRAQICTYNETRKHWEYKP